MASGSLVKVYQGNGLSSFWRIVSWPISNEMPCNFNTPPPPPPPNHFLFRKCIWKCSLQNVVHFVQVLMCFVPMLAVMSGNVTNNRYNVLNNTVLHGKGVDTFVPPGAHFTNVVWIISRDILWLFLITLINWVCYHILRKMWDGCAYPFPNVNGSSVEVWEWIGFFIPHSIMDVTRRVEGNADIFSHPGP